MDDAVTCLIPAFKVEYFHELLNCLRSQRVRPARIIVSDDTQDDVFLHALRDDPEIAALGKALAIVAVRGPRTGHQDNIEYLLSVYLEHPTPFFHILLDDDLIAPTFYATHFQAHRQAYSLCSVSRRVIGSDKGLPVKSVVLPEELRELTGKIVTLNLDFLIATAVLPLRNWLGELSTMVLRQTCAKPPKAFCEINGISFAGLNDLGTVVKCALEGPILFVARELSLFRSSRRGISVNQGYFYSLSLLAPISLALALHKAGHLNAGHLQRMTDAAITRWERVYGSNRVGYELGLALVQLQEGHYPQFRSRTLALLDQYRGYKSLGPKLSTRHHLLAFLEGSNSVS